jgi:hypothetical protein
MLPAFTRLVDTEVRSARKRITSEPFKMQATLPSEMSDGKRSVVWHAGQKHASFEKECRGLQRCVFINAKHSTSIDHVLLDDIRVSWMYDLSGELTVIVITMWQLESQGKTGGK